MWSPGGRGFSLADKLCNRRNQVLSIVLGCQHDVLFQQSVSHISIRGALYRNSSQTQHPAYFISQSIISVFSLLFVFSFTEQVHWTERRYTHSHVLLGKGNSFQILNLQTSKQIFILFDSIPCWAAWFPLFVAFCHIHLVLMTFTSQMAPKRIRQSLPVTDLTLYLTLLCPLCSDLK